jgi:DNA helicase II / ATP-dependent DNA helicase PcrA
MKWNDNLEEGTPAYNLASSTARTIRSVAGPGAGKSFAIQRRITRLMSEGFTPERILAITFTRTAAKDLKRDISNLKVENSENVVARTLHSHALSILMRADIIEQTARTPRMILEHEIKPALRDLGKEKYGSVNNREDLKDAYLAAWATLQVDEPGFTKDDQQENFEKDLTDWMKFHSGMLIGEVIPEAVKYLKFNPACSAIDAYDVILVDEYQDLNKAEQEFIRLIRGNAQIVIVGDDDQSIYGFKYAHPEGIRTIANLHGAFTDVPFEQCRRCPTDVTLLASQLISNNPNRTLGNLIPYDKNPAGKINIIQWNTYEEEVPGIVKIIQQELSLGKIYPKDVLILAPRRRIGYLLRDSLLHSGIPVKSYFRESAMKKLPVQRSYSLLNFLAFPDDSIALRFLLGVGSNDFRANQYRKLTELSREKGVSIREILDLIITGNIDDTGLTTIIKEYRKILTDIILIKQCIKDAPEELFINIFITNEELESDFYELNQIYQDIITDCGVDEAKNDDTQIEWIKKVFMKMQEVVTNPDIPDDIDHIRIMSLHSSKGLSSKFVIICSMVDELMPFLPSKLTPEEMEVRKQEQRRLFYVAITRCKGDETYEGRLLISSFVNIPGTIAVNLNIPAKPNMNRQVKATRFIQELGQTAPRPILGNTLVE